MLYYTILHYTTLYYTMPLHAMPYYTNRAVDFQKLKLDERTQPPAGFCTSEGRLKVGFNNLNLRIFNLRVSNPNKLILDVFFDTMSDFNVPGSRPKTTR